MTESDVALLLVLACAALVCDALRPAQRKRGWDNSRAATQRDVADVLSGKGRNRRDPRADPLYSLLLVFAFLALAWAILS